MQGIRDLLDPNTNKKGIRPNEQRYGEEYLKKVLLIFTVSIFIGPFALRHGPVGQLAYPMECC